MFVNRFRKILACSTLAIISGCANQHHEPALSIPESTSTLKRLATLPVGAEVTGLMVSPSGDFFFNVQHPSDMLPNDAHLATVGYVAGMSINDLPRSFTELPPPSKPEHIWQTRTAIGEFIPLVREGETFAGTMPFGLGFVPTLDNSRGLRKSDMAPEIRAVNRESIPEGMPDFNAFIPTDKEATEGYLYTNWEGRPSAMSQIKIARSNEGQWSVVDNDASYVNFYTPDLVGAWHLCAGSVSPWNTPLTAEELFVQAEEQADWNSPDPTVKASERAFGGAMFLDSEVLNYQDAEKRAVWPNPYRYGYIVEIEEADQPVSKPKKRYALGRATFEVAFVMPDLKTVYLTSDGTDRPFLKFIAENPKDLSKGALYAAKLHQSAGSSASKDASFTIDWIHLGNTDESEVPALISQYDGISLADHKAGETSYIPESRIDQYIAEFKAGAPLSEPAMPAVETVWVAKKLGASVEFNGMEGLAGNFKAFEAGHRYLYLATGNITQKMADGAGDIRLDSNACGAVYQLAFDSNYNVDSMTPAVVGHGFDPTAPDDKCPVDSVAQPDNLLMLDDGRLVIGEDSGHHRNNAIWIYDPEPHK